MCWGYWLELHAGYISYCTVKWSHFLDTHTHTPIIVIYFSALSVSGCNQRGQTANGGATFWLSNALWPIGELSLLRIANRWSRPTPPSTSMFYKGELHGHKMDACCVLRCLYSGRYICFGDVLWVLVKSFFFLSVRQKALLNNQHGTTICCFFFFVKSEGDFQIEKQCLTVTTGKKICVWKCQSSPVCCLSHCILSSLMPN